MQVAASANVRIATKHEVAFGEGIKVVGSGEKLGAWDPAAAPGLSSSFPLQKKTCAHYVKSPLMNEQSAWHVPLSEASLYS